MKKNNYIHFFVINAILFLTVISNTFAQDKKDEFKPEVKIGGRIFTGLEYNIDNANFTAKVDSAKSDSTVPFAYLPTKNQFEVSQNSFFLERAYINVLASLTPTIKGRITPDVFSYTDGAGKTQYALQIKYAWLN